MNYIYKRFFPVNSFTYVIFDKLSIYYNTDLFINKEYLSSIIITNKSNQTNKPEYNYKIELLDSSTIFNTMLSIDFDNQKLKIYEKIKFYNHKNTKRINYCCNITQDITHKISNDKPLIHSIKYCHQPIGFNLNNYYNNDKDKDIKNIFEYFIKTYNQKN